MRETTKKIGANNLIIEAKDSWICPTCGATHKAEDVTEEDKNAAIEANKKEEENLEKFNKLKGLSMEIYATARAKRQSIQEQLNSKISEVRTTYSSKLNSLNDKKSNFSKRLGELNFQAKAYETYIKASSKISTLESELEILSTKMNASEAKYENYNSAYKEIFGRDGLLAANILQKLADSLNEEGSLINISTCKVLKNGKIKPTLDISLNVDGSWQKYAVLSGGQTLFVDLYFMSKLISAVGGVGFLILDETFKYFDSSTKDEAIEILLQMKSNNIFLVNHGDISIGDDCTSMQVSRANGKSKYEF